MANSLKRAWEILLPSCVEELVEDNSFGLGPEQNVTPDQFYDILQLWWNQRLHLANIDQLQPNHLDILIDYLNNKNEEQTQIESKQENDNHTTIELQDIAKYLGFYQPKNGVCGFVAGLHAILLYKIWDQVINRSMQQTSQVIKPQIDSFKHLMISSIAHALITSANTASHPLEYEKKPLQSSAPKTWSCEHCKTNNATQNVFCKTCWKEPKPRNETSNTDTVRIDTCDKIYIVTGGELPIRSEHNRYNADLFGFTIHCIDYDQDDADAIVKIEHYLCNKLDFEHNFISSGCCIRILLSLILTHGIERCTYELLLQEYEEIYRQFRDESLILGKYGFCSQNVVNLTMFGHCKPVIDSPSYLSYPYGFLCHDVINPGATGFFQTGEGYEYPLYPIWVVLSGTHYTTLLAVATHTQSYNSQPILDCYHAMVKWMHTDTDNKNKNKNNNNSNNKNNNNNEWKCSMCAHSNDKTHVICGACFAEKVTNNEDKAEEAVHFEVDLISYNGLPPSGPLLTPISMHIITEKENANEKEERERVIQSNEVLSMIDHDESDETKKLKYIKGHALVQRIESKQRKNVYYYEIAITLESHFEEIQHWKSPYFMKFEDEQEWKKAKPFFDPKILPSDVLQNTNYEYPSIKWRCCSCYLGDDMTKKYAGYNNLENWLCRACSKAMYEGLRTLIVKYEHVPLYIRESKIDKVYQNALVKLLKKRFKDLVVGVVDTECLPVI